MKLRQTLIVKFTIVGIAISSSVTIAQVADSTFDLRRELAVANGLCIQVGIDGKTTSTLLDQRDLLVHCLDRRPEVVRALQRRVQRNEPDCSLIVELWTSRSLPHAENLANLILVNDPAAVDSSEVERVLRPGGVGLFRGDNGYSRLVKPAPSGTDDWTHQWHASGGGLTTEDRRIDVPQGIQWLAGPLFAMAGRKSSTQSLVSSGGVNFYVTQNVLENVGLPEMAQYLVARDAYNGLIMWQRRWTGTFVTGNGETNPRMVASPSRLYVAGENRLLSLNPKTGETISRSQQATNQRLQSIFAPRLDRPAKSHDWPIYRGSPNRAGFSQATLTPRMKRAWSIPIATSSNTVSQRGWKLRSGNLLTAPTIVGGAAFVAATDAGRLHAIDVSSGKTKWTFFANGRIDSPPTLYRGLCLFGSHDGYIYCLESKSGRLAWKFRAAPVERRIVAFGSIESAWPVAGSVLMRDGIVYAAAGRAPDADGGIEVHALDARSGKSIWSSKIQGGSFRGLCDYLVDADDAIYLANCRIDPTTGEHREADTTSPHLKGGKVGLLEASWTKHDLALRKAIQTWTAAGGSGQLLAFSPTVRASYQAESNEVLIACDETKHLAVKSPEQVTGLALTADFVVLAGGIDRSAALAGGFLRLVDMETGEIEVSIDLPAEAVFDGVALAGRRILVSTQDGCLHCFHASD